MKINRGRAEELCEGICKSLATWDVVRAVVQCGALEDKARGRFADAITKWLKAGERDLLVLPEYRPPLKKMRKHIDFALVRKDSIGKPVLKVDTIFEVKCNYASQITDSTEVVGELSRVKKAISQVGTYKTLVKADAAYLIYVITDCRLSDTDFKKVMPKRHDNGWKYYRCEHKRKSVGRDSVNAINKIRAKAGRRNVIGDGARRPHDGVVPFSCLLIRT
jgi:hypothetical protein